MARREDNEGDWYKLLQEKLAEARIRLELVPSGDLTGVLDAFLSDDNWDSTADVVRKFLSQYLMERYENLESKMLDLYLDGGEE